MTLWSLLSFQQTCTHACVLWSSIFHPKAERKVTSLRASDGAPKNISTVLLCADGRMPGGMWEKLRKRAGSQAQKFCNGI